MILPGATLGVLGGGQLGRMFTVKAQRMGYRVLVVDPDPIAPAAQIADHHVQLPWDDPNVPALMIAECDAVTTEFENVPAEVMRLIAKEIPVRPGADAVATTQDRVVEKAFLNAAGIPTARWIAVNETTDLAEAWDALGGLPAILKTARLGYDGKGQLVVNSLAELRQARLDLVTPCILENRVALKLEISVMVARGEDGTTVSWSASENVHRNGILHTSMVPASVAPELALEARRLAQDIATALEYVGVMGVECFVTEHNELLVNELAPRPHNSGHWTLDASVTSQFEQQVRILAGLPLGDTRRTSPVAMINLLGDLWPVGGAPPWEKALAIPGVRLHLYGKGQPRPGRKMGHLTATAEDGPSALAIVTQAWHALGGQDSRD